MFKDPYALVRSVGLAGFAALALVLMLANCSGWQ